jgi:LysM repeat protein
MKFRCLLLVSATALCSVASAQTNGKPDGAVLETIVKKLDEQNMKIDALSQQILKLEQQVSSARPPGVIIGEATPSATPLAATAVAAAPAGSSAAPPPSGNAHVVAKGETLISIAKSHKVDVDALQKHNNIEDARKLQAGQTIMIPTPGASPAASP